MPSNNPKGVRDYRNIAPLEPVDGSGMEIVYGTPPTQKLRGIQFTSGTTANRPTSPPTGSVYFDTDVGAPVWWDGSTWVSTSTAVTAHESTYDHTSWMPYSGGAFTNSVWMTGGTFGLVNGVAISEFSSDGTFAGNSNLAVPTEAAVKTYADSWATKSATIQNPVIHTYKVPAGQSMATATGSKAALEVKNDTAGQDAFMSFHVSGDYAAYFGIDGGTNDLAYGGWSAGATANRVFHQGNIKYAGSATGTINKVAASAVATCSSPPTLYNRFGFASISRLATGKYRFTLESGIMDGTTLYDVQATAGNVTNAYICTINAKTSTYCDIWILRHDNVLTDGVTVYVTVTSNSVTPGW